MIAEYKKPSFQNLNLTQDKRKTKIPTERAKIHKEALEKAIKDFNLHVVILDVIPTPLATVFKVGMEEGFSAKALKNAKVDLEVQLGGYIEIGRDDENMEFMYISVLYANRDPIGLKSLIDNPEFEAQTSPLTIAAGINVNGENIYINLEDAPHMLVEGTTGSGKTIFIDDILMSLIYKSSPQEAKFLLIDPKMVDLIPYEGIYHLYSPVITQLKNAADALNKIVKEMRDRYNLFSNSNVRNIISYNEKADEKLPRLVIVIDEYNELMEYVDEEGDKEIENAVRMIAQSGRAAGIHLVISTQSASRSVVDADILANIPCKVSLSNAYTVKTPDGKVRLLGAGDMIVQQSIGGKSCRGQAPYVTFEEIQSVVNSVCHRNRKSLF